MIGAIHVLLVITAANAAPVLLGLLLGQRPGTPVDAGRYWRDGRRVFGHAKSVRGLLVAVAAAGLTAAVLGLPLLAGLLAGALAMAGDLLSSFAKRRMALPPSSRFLGLDQTPEALLPLLALMPLASISAASAVTGAALFIILGPPVSWLLFRAGIRREPH
ncbi:CDP-archaeol synthase [Aquisalimonas lutea]|uniref:CDP-archaeol synthase n=1 Tax=Aquisalimonas lutea TaxID=1327750 RepID=UPI0025B357F4|nr:CDP-archaeol synthase [Aquisalimonas lutea]MDN3517943.1 CDP-archaeol synthase [Aquisalimonas lutea]